MGDKSSVSTTAKVLTTTKTLTTTGTSITTDIPTSKEETTTWTSTTTVTSIDVSDPQGKAIISTSTITGTSTITNISNPGEKTTTWTSTTSETSTITGISNPEGVNTTSSHLGPPGEVAGIAIGTTIIGLLLGFLLAWFLMSHREKSSSRRKHRRHREDEIGGAPPSRPKIALEDNLLERVDDSVILKSMRDLNILIEGHVKNSYHTHQLDGSQGNLARQLHDFGVGNGTDTSADTLAFLLIDPRTRSLAIRHFIASTLLAHINWKAAKETSLLPPQLAAICESIPPIERQFGFFNKALSQWRYLTAFLIQPMRTSRDAPKPNKEKLQGSLALNVERINEVLHVFIKADPEIQRYQKENLGAIAFKVAELGLILFSQPSTWVFEWTQPGRRSTEKIGGARHETLTLFPALSEVTEKDGNHQARLVVDWVATKV